jgi:hypothetical protein
MMSGAAGLRMVKRHRRRCGLDYAAMRPCSRSATVVRAPLKGSESGDYDLVGVTRIERLIDEPVLGDLRPDLADELVNEKVALVGIGPGRAGDPVRQSSHCEMLNTT